MNLTHQQMIALGAMVFCVLLTAGTLCDFTSEFILGNTEMRIQPRAGDLTVKKADDAIKPLIDDLSVPLTSDPFTEKRSAVSNRLPPPPAPPLDPPLPPPLPLAMPEK
jgi:hypothetical protein